MTAQLVLEDGTTFSGKLFGYQDFCQGEIVFNTDMIGYQKILSDPSYAGQIVVMTYPLIGNHGINSWEEESNNSFVKGVIVQENCLYHNNWQSRGSLANYLKNKKIVGLTGIDTRSLTKYLCSKGTMQAEITQDKANFSSVIVNPAYYLTKKDIVHIHGQGPRMVVIDFGIKNSILEILKREAWEIFIVPCWTTAAEILSLQPQGLFLSNGPGNPQELSEVVHNIKKLIKKLPIFGIGLGHQIISLALGADTYKLKLGHRGNNHPVKDLIKNKVYITNQNHGFAVQEKTLPTDIIVTYRNLNDQSIEGIKHKFLPIFSVQFHPQPGSEENNIIRKFAEIVACKGA